MKFLKAHSLDSQNETWTTKDLAEAGEGAVLLMANMLIERGEITRAAALLRKTAIDPRHSPGDDAETPAMKIWRKAPAESMDMEDEIQSAKSRRRKISL